MVKMDIKKYIAVLQEDHANFYTHAHLLVRRQCVIMKKKGVYIFFNLKSLKYKKKQVSLLFFHKYSNMEFLQKK